MMPNAAYEPSDEVRVFDGAEEEEDVEGSRLPLLIVLALLVLAMFAGVVWLAYQRRRRAGAWRNPARDRGRTRTRKVAPPAPGGTPTPYKGFKIYEQPRRRTTNASATPSAEPVRSPPSLRRCPLQRRQSLRRSKRRDGRRCGAG